MEKNFNRALLLVLKHEGGYVNHPRDPGGATNKGVTIATFRRYVKKNGTVEDLKNITNEQVASVYKKHYWDKVRGNELPSGVDYAVFDFAVNSGPSRSIKFLQRILGLTQDGVIGPVTLQEVNKHDPAKIINALCDARMAFLRGLKTFSTFGKGWTSRVTGVRKESLAMVGNSPTIVEPAKPKPAAPTTPVVTTPKPTITKEPVTQTKPAPTLLEAFIAMLKQLFGVK